MPVQLELLVNPVRPQRIESELFSLEEVEQAEQAASRSNGAVYCWKTTGTQNWLERGLSIVDVLGLVILPASTPAFIDMPDDPPSD